MSWLVVNPIVHSVSDGEVCIGVVIKGGCDRVVVFVLTFLMIRISRVDLVLEVSILSLIFLELESHLLDVSLELLNNAVVLNTHISFSLLVVSDMGDVEFTQLLSQFHGLKFQWSSGFDWSVSQFGDLLLIVSSEGVELLGESGDFSVQWAYSSFNGVLDLSSESLFLSVEVTGVLGDEFVVSSLELNISVFLLLTVVFPVSDLGLIWGVDRFNLSFVV